MAKAKKQSEKKYKLISDEAFAAMQGTYTVDARGIACRVCGCRHHYTLETEPTTEGRVRRRRRCRNCGFRFTTYELP
jgi:hypothetical protein